MKLLSTKKTILLLLTIVLITLFIAIGYYLFNNLEKYTVKKALPVPAKVKKNPYLAMEYFLEKQQQQVTKQRNTYQLKTLPTDNQTLFLLGKRNHFTPSQNQQILDWVKKGGRLIVEADRTTHTKNYVHNDLLLKQLGITLEDIDYDDDQDAKKSAITKLFIEGEKEPATLYFPPNHELIEEQDNARLWANDENEYTHIIQLDYGKGKVTILSDASLWKNYNIKQHDHAWLVSYLTAGNNVAIIYNPVASSSDSSNQSNPLLTILKNYPYSVLALVLLIIAILWHTAVRTGPLEPALERNRRRLPEQLHAQANFLYVQTGQQQLLTVLQQEINYRTKKCHPHFEALTTQQQHQLLSKLTQQPIELISELMNPTVNQQKLSKLAFIKTVIALQAIRNEL